MENVSVAVKTFKSHKTGKDYEAIELNIGRWTGKVFSRSPFELDYIKAVLSGEDNER